MKSRGSRGQAAGGYTIVEVLIVLAISAAMMVASMALISGKQQKAGFSVASRDILSQLKTSINATVSGRFPNEGDYKCSSGYPHVTVESYSSPTPPDNSFCMFVGSVFVFHPATADSIVSYPLVGKRAAGQDPVPSLADAVPAALSPGSSTNTTAPDKSSKIALKEGLRYVGVSVNGGSLSLDTFALAIIPPVGEDATAIGNSSARYYALPTTIMATETDLKKIVDAINNQTWSNVVSPTSSNPSYTICFSADDGQSVAIRFSGGGIEPSMQIKEGNTCGFTT